MIHFIKDKASNPADRRQATTTITISVNDVDDLGPKFVYAGCVEVDNVCFNPTYSTSVTSGSTVSFFVYFSENLIIKIYILTKKSRSINSFSKLSLPLILKQFNLCINATGRLHLIKIRTFICPLVLICPFVSILSG